MRATVPIDGLRAAAYRVPTESTEADGTAEWTSTTLVTAHVSGGGRVGFGYSYGSDAMVPIIEGELAPRLRGLDALGVEAAYDKMGSAMRNIGRPGVVATAISAVDIALWDLKARLLEVPLVRLLGAVRAAAPLYGSGGFTSEDVPRLQRQLTGWVELGLRAVKMKIGSQPSQDVARVGAARKALGDDVTLMVDANGAYTVKQALRQAEAFGALGVRWFEEPVSSDNLEGLAFVRAHAPPVLDVAAGEYGYDGIYFRRMLEGQAVDVLQADATRCGGITGFLWAARLCEAFFTPLSAHTAPSLHAQVGCVVSPLVNVEYFFDHVRIEERLFDGFIAPKAGAIAPDLSRPGLGLELKERDAECHRVR